jgi:hypothetical protein
MQEDDQKPIVPDKDDDRKIGKDIPFKKSYQPDEDDLDKPPRGSGGPPPRRDDKDEE